MSTCWSAPITTTSASQIHDNGDPLPANDREALLADGLRRISSLDGSLDIAAAPDGHGTILAWQVPIPSEAETAG